MLNITCLFIGNYENVVSKDTFLTYNNLIRYKKIIGNESL